MAKGVVERPPAPQPSATAPRQFGGDIKKPPKD